jgi:hypothetical protein
MKGSRKGVDVVKSKFAVLMLVAVLAGCSSVGEVQRTSLDTYAVECTKGGQFWTFGPSWMDVKAMCLSRANEICLGQSKVMIVNGWETHGARGWTPLTAELSFKCISEPKQQ